MWVWAVVAVMAVGANAVITEVRIVSKQIDVKRLNQEIELEKLRKRDWKNAIRFGTFKNKFYYNKRKVAE